MFFVLSLTGLIPNAPLAPLATEAQQSPWQLSYRPDRATTTSVLERDTCAELDDTRVALTDDLAKVHVRYLTDHAT